MAAQNYSFLEQHDEDNLHKSRLLPIEQRPFQRVTKRLLSHDSLLLKPSLPTKSPAVSTPTSSPSDDLVAARKQWHSDMLLELAGLEATVTRIHLLRQTNARECARYDDETSRIHATAADLRANTADLRVQLGEAQRTLALRKEYDVLAEKITGNRMLRPREDQLAQLDKLRGEIAELEAERGEYKRTWGERREQFGRIVDEGRQMLRLIRDEKEEAERKEGMEGTGDSGVLSAVATPRPEDNTAGGSTPLPTAPGDDGLLKPAVLAAATASVGTKGGAGSRAASVRGEGDVEMLEVVDLVRTDAREDELEEGEEEEGEEREDRMEVS